MPPPILEFSKAMEALYFERVIRPIWNDPRTDWDVNISLGYPFKVIRDEVIDKGRADFCKGHEHNHYGTLTADEKVLLYCFVNMKLHYFEALATFQAYKKALQSFVQPTRATIMVDLGCGPGTAGLAFSECYRRPTMHYLGVDIAKGMRRKAKSMLQAAIDGLLLGKESLIETTSSWLTLRKLPAALQRPANVLFNATDLFASESLDVDDVCASVMAFKEARRVKQLAFVYSNTEVDIAGEKFRLFKRKMTGEYASFGRARTTVRYRKKRSSDAIFDAAFVRQLLVFKE